MTTSRVGILMLQTRFPRPPGDIGNPATFDFPVCYRVVSGASPAQAVLSDPDSLLVPFIATGQELVAAGCRGLVTSCGFLTPFQSRLATACGVPVATSALLQYPWIQALLAPGRRVGIVTIAASALTPTHLQAVGIPVDTPVVGTDQVGNAFSGTILSDSDSLDREAAGQDVQRATSRLLQDHPEVGAILLECTNMPPYIPQLRQITTLPIFSVVDLVRWFHHGL